MPQVGPDLIAFSVADAMTVGLTRNGTAARPLGAGITTAGLTVIP